MTKRVTDHLGKSNELLVWEMFIIQYLNDEDDYKYTMSVYFSCRLCLHLLHLILVNNGHYVLIGSSGKLSVLLLKKKRLDC